MANANIAMDASIKLRIFPPSVPTKSSLAARSFAHHD